MKNLRIEDLELLVRLIDKLRDGPTAAMHFFLDNRADLWATEAKLREELGGLWAAAPWRDPEAR